MIFGIDASNIREGGGLTHLKSILQFANPEQFGVSKIVIWSSQKTLNQLPNLSFVEKKTHTLLNRSTIHAFLFQYLKLKKLAKKEKCQVIFAPGGTFISSFRPFVTMSQNMLPFEWEEAKNYGWKMRLRLKILHYTQARTFRKANGLIFLTNYAKDYISNAIKLKDDNVIIPHGVTPAFKQKPKIQKRPSDFSNDNPFEMLYVSYITVYKHQWNVAEAVCQLNQEGFPIRIKFIGSILDSFEKFKDILEKYPNSKKYIEYISGLPHEELIFHYHISDAFIFASTCENMPIILIEAMSAGLPIISSSYGPMPEVLGSSGIYFDPRDVKSIKDAIKLLYENEKVREIIANDSYDKAIKYTWENCSNNTLDYICKIGLK